MPTGEQVQKAVLYLDGAIKFEIMINSFHNTMKLTSFTECTICVLMAGFFIRSPGAMYFFFLHAPHVIRALVAIDICNRVPCS